MFRRRSLIFALSACMGLASQANAVAEDAPLAHMVFFTLKDRTPANRDALLAGCKKYLGGHEGTVHFSVGTRGTEFDRDVNATDYDVALHLIFESKAAHDAYQVHPRHQKFIDENQRLWGKVRVYDSYLIPTESK